MAEAAASATSVAAISETVAKLEAGMPSKEELATVQEQLGTLQNGMAALDNLSHMSSEVCNTSHLRGLQRWNPMHQQQCCKRIFLLAPKKQPLHAAAWKTTWTPAIFEEGQTHS